MKCDDTASRSVTTFVTVFALKFPGVTASIHPFAWMSKTYRVAQKSKPLYGFSKGCTNKASCG